MTESVHRGSDFDDFLKEEGILAEVEILALKRLEEAGASRSFEAASLSLEQATREARSR